MELPKYKICPECGKHNPPNLLECRFCEADLTGVKVTDQNTEAAASRQPEPPPAAQTGGGLVRVCECGAENPPQARKCAACGEDISDILPTPSGKPAADAFRYELEAVDGSFRAAVEKPVVVVGRGAFLQEHLQGKSYVGRQQARFTVAAGKVFVEDLSRTNRTFLNNDELPVHTPVAVKDGDEIGLGGKVIAGARQELAAYLIVRVKS